MGGGDEWNEERIGGRDGLEGEGDGMERGRDGWQGEMVGREGEKYKWEGARIGGREGER